MIFSVYQPHYVQWNYCCINYGRSCTIVTNYISKSTSTSYTCAEKASNLLAKVKVSGMKAEGQCFVQSDPFLGPFERSLSPEEYFLCHWISKCVWGPLRVEVKTHFIVKKLCQV